LSALSRRRPRELIKLTALRLLELAYGRRARAHRILFGPLAGGKLFIRPAISLRMLLGLDEPDVASMAGGALRPGDVVYDVGAHVGYTCLLFARLVGPSGSVQAFELLPSTAAMLRKTIELNHLEHCGVHEIGLSDSDRSSLVGINAQAMGSSEFARDASYAGPAEECRIRRLDGYRAERALPAPTLIKIDVEGAEIAMLRGARQTLRECEPLLIVEFHHRDLLCRGLELLAAEGYEVRLPHGARITPDEAARRPSFYGNALAHRPRCAWHRERVAFLTGEERSD